MNSLPVLLLRSTVFYIGYVPVTIIMSTVFILVFPILPRKGRYIFAATWCNTMLGWLRISCGVRYTIVGSENIPRNPAIILSNHQSSWETILFYKLIFPASPILKTELLRIPFWGWAMRLQNPIAIDRSKPREAGKSLLTQGVERIEGGNSIIVFPEGTRSPAGTVRKFSRGGAKLAVAAKVPIVPIAHNAGDCWPPRRFIIKPGLIEVVIGEAIQTDGKTANELTDLAEQWIRQQLSL